MIQLLKKTNLILGCIRQGTSSRERSISTIVQDIGRLHLEYFMHFLSPVLKKIS